MNTLKNIKIFLKDFLYPIPNLEREANKFFLLNFHYLSIEHITEIVRIILKEVKYSRTFDLFIESRHLEKEETLFLAAINKLGGPRHMQLHVPYDEARTIFFELADSSLLEMIVYYRQRGILEGGVKTKYNCHIQAVIHSLLYEIYCVSNKHFN